MATTAAKQTRPATKAPPPKAQPAPDPESEPEEGAAPPKKKRSLLKIALLLILPLAAAGGGYWYYLRDQEPAAVQKPGGAKTAAGKPVAAKPVSAKPPVFVTLEPFTVNLQQEDTGAQYLQVGLSLKAEDELLADAVKLRLPEIRNRVLLLLSSKKASEIATLEGKKTLSADLGKEIAQALAGSAAAKSLDSVLFTSFVIQ